jgi:hypothetical protein
MKKLEQKEVERLLKEYQRARDKSIRFACRLLAAGNTGKQ